MTGKNEATSKLCPACGLCCNGVLFGDVELQKRDDAERLRKLGVGLFRKGSKTCFSQPCSCFDGKLCRIYEDRPNRCRTFECRLLMRVQSGEVTSGAALKAIAKARDAVEAVLELVRESGNQDEHVPLNLRYAEVAARAIDLAGSRDVFERRRRLMLAVGKLTRLLERDFLT